MFIFISVSPTKHFYKIPGKVHSHVLSFSELYLIPKHLSYRGQCQQGSTKT